MKNRISKIRNCINGCAGTSLALATAYLSMQKNSRVAIGIGALLLLAWLIYQFYLEELLVESILFKKGINSVKNSAGENRTIYMTKILPLVKELSEGVSQNKKSQFEAYYCWRIWLDAAAFITDQFMDGDEIDSQQVMLQINSYRNSVIYYPELKEGIDILIDVSSRFTRDGTVFTLPSASDSEKGVLNDQINMRIERLKSLLRSADKARQK